MRTSPHPKSLGKRKTHGATIDEKTIEQIFSREYLGRGLFRSEGVSASRRRSGGGETVTVLKESKRGGQRR